MSEPSDGGHDAAALRSLYADISTVVVVRPRVEPRRDLLVPQDDLADDVAAQDVDERHVFDSRMSRSISS